MSAGANHQPTTPVPWSAQRWTNHAARTVLVDDPSAITGKKLVADCPETGDAAYLVHAANAYPALIAACRAALSQGPSDGNREIRTVLRELGESS